MKRKYKKNPKKQVKIAKERIKKLFEQAEIRFKEDPKLANRYVYLARKIAMKLKIRIPPSLKRRFCKHCYSYLVPNKNCRVRIRKDKIIYTCFNCKKFMRFGYRKKIKNVIEKPKKN